VLRAVGRSPVRLAFPDGRHVGGGGPDDPALTVHDPDAFLCRLGADALVGFGESYMAGEWDADDLVGVLTAPAAHALDVVPAPLQWLRGL